MFDCMSDKLFLQALDIVFDDFNVDCSAGSLSIDKNHAFFKGKMKLHNSEFLNHQGKRLLGHF